MSQIRTAGLRRFGLPAFAAVAVGLALVSGGTEAKLLDATSDPQPEDADQDGLSDHQEEILNTFFDQPDSDQDGFDDVVELARNSDPLNANSTPAAQQVSVGMTARSDGGTVTIVSAVYANHSQFPSFGFQMGVSIDGQEVVLPTSVVLASSSMALHPGLDPSGWIIVLETPIPQTLLSAYGYVGVYTLVSATGATSPTAAAVMNLFEVAGHPVAFAPSPTSVQSGTGSIYKPLGREEEQPASTWTQGLVCWQLTEVVGTDGNSIILDVEDAECKELDSACNASHCQGGIGTTVKVLDAGALVGGS